MSTEWIKLRLRKAHRADLFDKLDKPVPGVVFAYRSLQTREFGILRSTSSPDLDVGRLYIAMTCGAVYIQQQVVDIPEELDSTSVSIPVRVASHQDVISNKTLIDGAVYFKKYSSGKLSNILKQINHATHYGDFAFQFKEKRIYVPCSWFQEKMIINDSAFAKAG